MSLDTVVEDIRDEARARADEIRSEAEARAADIVAEAEEDADRIVDERERAVERQVDQEREQALSSAKLEAKQQRLKARRDALQRVREAVDDGVANIDGDRRETLTRALVEDAADEFASADEVAVYGRAEDEALLTDICSAYEGWSFAGERDCLGGVVVESTGSRVRVNNTFDSVLEDVWEDNLKELSDRLFEQ